MVSGKSAAIAPGTHIEFKLPFGVLDFPFRLFEAPFCLRLTLLIFLKQWYLPQTSLLLVQPHGRVQLAFVILDELFQNPRALSLERLAQTLLFAYSALLKLLSSRGAS
jgi:hypothetical protein